MSESPTDFLAQYLLIRALELKLEKLEYGLAMPLDKDAIAQTRVMLQQARSRLVVREHT
jgi:hypothetical protein